MAAEMDEEHPARRARRVHLSTSDGPGWVPNVEEIPA